MLNSKNISNNELTPITENECKFFQSGRSEGAPYLFYDHEEFCDLMGHKIEFYSNGVLLSLREDVKDFETSRSYVFFNNKGQKVLDIHNRNSVRDPKTKERTLFPPKKDIEVKVFNDYISVKETDFETDESCEYFIDVLTLEKHTVAKDEQLSMDL